MSIKSYTVKFSFDDEKETDKRLLEIINDATVDCAISGLKNGLHQDFTAEDGIKSIFYKAICQEMVRRI